MALSYGVQATPVYDDRSNWCIMCLCYTVVNSQNYFIPCDFSMPLLYASCVILRLFYAYNHDLPLSQIN
jgi:hypothetical protein